MHRRFILVLRLLLLLVIVSGMLFQPQNSASAASDLVVSPLTWNIVGLDSNSPSVGPYRFPVAVRACNPGSNTVTMFDVEADFVWLSGGTTNDDSIIQLRPGSLDPIAPNPQIDLAPGSCYDFYFEVEVNRFAASPYNQTRRYRIDIHYDDPEIAGTQTVSSTTPRELFVEHLISQSRNAITDVLLNGASVPAGGSMNLLVGNTYTITLEGGTATQGYNQFEAFINFPNTIFQILSVSTDYSANDSPYVSTNDHEQLYADACKWENDPNSPNYRSCIGGDYKSGGSNVVTTYVIKIIGGGGTTQTLNTLLYDFSGSSYHYNADYSLGARFANIIDPANVTIAKSFSPNPTNVNGISALTITLTNPNAGAISGYNFTDPLPSGLVVATPPNASTTSCGTPTFAPTADATSISFSNGTIASNGSCTIKVNVTPSTTGSFLNTTNHLFVDLLDTGQFATSTLTVNTTPPLPTPPSTCTTPVELARWEMNAAQGTSVPPVETSSAVDVDDTQTAASYVTVSGSSTISLTGSPTANSWAATAPTAGSGWSETPSSMNNYFQFEVDTDNYGGVYVVFDVGLFDNGDWANPTSNVYVNTSANGGTFTSYEVSPGTYLQANKGSWTPGLTATAASTGSDYTTFRFGVDGASKASAQFRLDDIIFYGCERLDPPTITKAFSPNPIAEGGTSTLTFTLTNPNADPLAGLTFTDTLPTGVTLASTPTTTCGGPVTGTLGGSTINLTGGNLTGTIAVTNGSTTVTGTGTNFLNELAVGRVLLINSVRYTISAIASNTSLTLSAAYPGTTASGLTVSGQLAGSGTCTVTATVTSSTAGAYQNVSGFVSSSNGGTNTGATGSASASLTVIEPPQIDKLFSPNPILAGGTSSLTFTVINPNQNDALTGVTFTDTFPTSPGAMTVASPLTTTLTGCGTGTLQDNTGGALAAGDPGIRLTGATVAAGGTCTIEVNVTVPATPTSGNYANTTTAVSSTNGGTGNTASDTLTVEPPDPSIALYKQVGPSNTGPWSKFLGVTLPGNVYYLFTVENTGNVPLSPVSVNDPTVNVSGCTWPASLPVAVAANDNHIATCVVGPVTAVTGSITNTATASGTYGGTPYTSTSSSATYASQALTLAKSVTQTSFTLAGETLNYSYLVTNSGFTPLLGPVTVSDDKATVACPAVSAVGDGDDWLDPANYPTPGSPAESITCTATYTVQPADATAGFVTNTASASVAGVTSNTDSETVNQLRSDLTITKTNNVSGTIAQNGSFTWTLTVANGGTANAVFTNGQTILSDPLPAGPTYGVPSAGNFTGVTNSGNINCSVAAGVLSCSASGADVTVGTGGSFAVSFTVTPVATGSLSNTATVDPNGNVTEGNEANNISLDIVNVTAVVDVSLDKQVSNATPNVGSTVTFTLVVVNAGPSTATNIVVTDVVPSGYTYVGASIAGGTSRDDSNPAGSGLTWTINSLASGVSTNLTYQATVLGTGTYNNYAEITSHAETDSDSTPGDASTTQDDDDTEVVTPVSIQPPAFAKQFSPNPIAVNTVSTLTLTITNPNAGSVLNGIAFTDNLPTGMQVAGTPNATTSGCGAPTFSPGAGNTSLTFSGGTIAAASTCTVSVNVVATTPGTKTNTTGNVSSTNGGTGNTATAKLGVINAVKTVIATSEIASSELNAPRLVLIGEVVRYHLVIDLPEGTTTNLQFVDHLVANMAYLNDGSTRVAFVCNSGASCASSSDAGIGTNPVVAGNTSAITPTFVLPAATISGDTGNPYSDGVDPIFSLGNVTNNDNDADAEYVVIEFNALVRNTTGNQDTNTRGNDFTVNVSGSALITSTDNANSRVTITEPVISSITKSITTTPTNPGDPIEYQLQFTNTGTAPAFDIAITDTLDALLTTTVTVSGSTTGGSCGSTASTVSGSYSAPTASATVTCLAVGGTATINITATVSNSAPAGSTITNTAILTYTSLPGTGSAANPTGSVTPGGGTNNSNGERNGSGTGANDYIASSNTVTTTLPSPELTIVKTLNSNMDEDGSGTVSLGDTLIYFVTVTNTGNTDLTNMVISDSLVTPNSFTCGLLPPGNFCVLRGTYVVTQADVDTGQIMNTGSVTDDDVCPAAGAATCQDSLTVPVPQGPDLMITKTMDANDDEDGSGTVSLNDTLTYNVTVTNLGNTTLTNVVVTDTLTTPNTITCANVSPGNTCVLTGTHVVTQTDVNNGQIVNTGSVTDDDVCTTACSAPHTEPVPQNPAITLAKTGTLNDDDGTPGVSAGDTISYEFMVTNSGNVTLTNITLADTVGGVTIAGGPITSLAPGVSDNNTFTGNYIVTQADIDTGSFTNTATVTGTPPSGPNVSDPDDDTQTLSSVPALAIVKSSNATGTNAAGDTITYTYDVENTGNVALSNVAVTDAHVGLSAITCTPAQGSTLLPGETMQCDATYAVTQADVNAGQIDNTGVVTGTPATGPNVTSNDSLSEPVAQNPAITIVKSSNATGTNALGDTVIYTYDVENTGNVTLTNVAVTDAHVGLSAITCTPAQGSSLLPGGTMQCTATYSVSQADIDAGQINNTGVVTGTPPIGPNVADNDPLSEPVAQNPALSIVKSSNATGTNVLGDILTYTYDVENTGNVTLTNVMVTDGHAGLSAITCTPAQGSTLLPGGTMQCNATYSVTQTDVDAGQIDNTGVVTGTPPTGPNVSANDPLTEPVAQNPAITIVKTSNATGTNVVGDSITYTYDVENTGNVRLSNVTVTDAHVGLSVISCTPVQGSTLQPGDTMSCTAAYTVTQTDLDAGHIDNTGVVIGTPPTGPNVSANDPLSEPVTRNPAIAIVKSSNASGTNAVGDLITYTYNVQNTGNVTLSNVTVTDAHVGLTSITCTPAQGSTLLPGGTMQCTATYSVTQADVDAGQINNTGVVTGTPPSGPDVTANDPLSEPVAQNPSLTLVKSETSTGPYAVNDTITYSVVATNNGNTTVTNVLVSDPKLTPSSTACASVAPLGTCVLNGSYTVTQADLDAGSFTNTGSVTDDDVCPAAGATTCEDTVTVTFTPTPALTIAKSETSSGPYTVGDSITYHVVVTNTGNTTLTNVEVSDLNLTPNSNTCASVIPSGTCTLIGTYTVQQADLDAGSFTNTGSVTDDDVCPAAGAATCQDNVTVNFPQNPDLTIAKRETSTGPYAVGDTITYDIVVTNTGNTTLASVLVSDPDLTPNNVTCASIAPLGTCTLTGSYMVQQSDVDAGSFANTGLVTDDDVCPAAGPATCEDTVTVNLPQNPDLTITKSITSTGPYGAGDIISYDVVVTNTGNTTLTNVDVSDPNLTPNITTCASLAPLGTCTLTGTYTVQAADVTAGSFTNTASVTDDDICPAAGTATCQDSVTVPISSVLVVDPAISKAGSPSQASVGETVTFTLVVTNEGNTPAPNVVVTDVLPSIFDVTAVNVTGAPLGTLVNVTPAIGTGPAPYTVVVTLAGDLGVTDVVTIQIVTTVNAIGNPPITNSASLTTSAQTDVISNNSDSVTISIRNSATTKTSSATLPATGFAPNVITDLSNVPQQAYTATGDLTIEIPSLNLKIPVVGVPKKDGTWNVAWLSNQAGWLEGTAFPSWSGNSVLTGHVYLSNGLPGPFLNLGKLKYGDTLVIHAYGQKYTFEVRENKIVEPNDTSVMKHEEKSWLTLITCKEYDPATNTYRKRVVVRAVLVSVAWE